MICASLHEAFPGVAIHKEHVPQGFSRPAMLVLPINAAHDQEIGNRYRRDYDLVIHYFPDVGREATFADVNPVANDMTKTLAQMENDGDTASAHGMSWQVDDGVLHFFATVTQYLKRDLPAGTRMEKITLEVE